MKKMKWFALGCIAICAMGATSAGYIMRFGDFELFQSNATGHPDSSGTYATLRTTSGFIFDASDSTPPNGIALYCGSLAYPSLDANSLKTTIIGGMEWDSAGASKEYLWGNATTMYAGNRTATFDLTNKYVGLGKSPSCVLDVSGAQSIYGRLTINADTGNAGDDFNFIGSDSGSVLYVDNAGYVGIETDVPAYPLDVNGTAMFRGDIIESATGTHSLTVGYGDILNQGGLANGAYNEGMVFDSTTTLNPTIFKVPIPIKELGSQVVVDSFTIQISCDSSTATISRLTIALYDINSGSVSYCYSATDATQLNYGINTYEIEAEIEDGFQPGQAMWLEFGLATGMATQIVVSGITINYHLSNE